MKVGQTILIADKKILEHFGGYLSPKGKIVKINPNKKIGLHLRPIGVKFEDRDGIYWYNERELKVLGSMGE